MSLDKTTKSEVLERFRDCLSALRLDGEKLTKNERERINYNFTLFKLYNELLAAENKPSEQLFACGFQADESDELDDEDDNFDYSTHTRRTRTILKKRRLKND